MVCRHRSHLPPCIVSSLHRSGQWFPVRQLHLHPAQVIADTCLHQPQATHPPSPQSVYKETLYTSQSAFADFADPLKNTTATTSVPKHCQSGRHRQVAHVQQQTYGALPTHRTHATSFLARTVLTSTKAPKEPHPQESHHSKHAIDHGTNELNCSEFIGAGAPLHAAIGWAFDEVCAHRWKAHVSWMGREDNATGQGSPTATEPNGSISRCPNPQDTRP